MAQLKERGFKRVFYWVDYFVQRAMFYEGLKELDMFEKNKEKIKTVLSLLNDDESRDVLCGFIRACITKKFADNIKYTDANEYDPKRTPATTNWNCMIDAGAYIGDSLERAMVYREHLESYIAFEPDWKNFKGLCRTVKEFGDNITRAVLLPCAAGGDNRTVSFEAAEDVNSKIADIGENAVPMIRLDDVIQNHSSQDHLLIKMDIEGMELEALKGCADIINAKGPDFMICVYHRVTDMWEIPLYLHSLQKGYRFDMRCYTVFGGETILYATCG